MKPAPGVLKRQPAPEVQVQVMRAEPIDQHYRGYLAGGRQCVPRKIRARVTGHHPEAGCTAKAVIGSWCRAVLPVDPREMQASPERCESHAGPCSGDAKPMPLRTCSATRGVVEEQAISQQEYDSAVARLRTAQADCVPGQGPIGRGATGSGLHHDQYPIAGRAGRAEVTEGALVSATEATLLTRVEQFDPSM